MIVPPFCACNTLKNTCVRDFFSLFFPDPRVQHSIGIKIEHPRAEDSMKAWQSAADGGEGEARGEI